tara:strand:+ start:5334 stop:5948 length:615 start_codon:yes stop_codon:yes gene_type:complete
MIKLKNLLGIFVGKRPVESIANDNISLKEGLLNYAVPFLLVMVLLSIEAVFFRIGSGLFSGEDLVAMFIGLVILVIGLLFAIPLSFIVQVVAIYVLGAVMFLVGGIYRKERGGMNDFNGALLTLFASVVLFVGLLSLIPIIGWIAAIVAKIYAIVLIYNFVRARFNLSDSQSAIIVLIPVDLIMAFVLIIATAISFFLIGSRVL